MAHHFNSDTRDYTKDIEHLWRIILKWQNDATRDSSQVKDLRSMSLTKISEIVERYFEPSEQYSAHNHYIAKLGAFQCELDMDYLAVMLKELDIDLQGGPAFLRQKIQRAAENEAKRESASRTIIRARESLQEFTCFSKLPLELQRLIWKSALPGPRVLDLHEDHKAWFDNSRQIHQRFYAIALACKTSNQVLNETYSTIKLYRYRPTASRDSVLYIDPANDIYLLSSVNNASRRKNLYQAHLYTSEEKAVFRGTLPLWIKQNFRTVATYHDTLTKALGMRPPPRLFSLLLPETRRRPFLTDLRSWTSLKALLVVDRIMPDLTNERFLLARENRAIGMTLTTTANGPIPILEGPIQYSPHTFVPGRTDVTVSKFREVAASHQSTAHLGDLDISFVDKTDEFPTRDSGVDLSSVLGGYNTALVTPATAKFTPPPHVITQMPRNYSWAPRTNLPGGRFEDAYEEEEVRHHFCSCKILGRIKVEAPAHERDYKGKREAADYVKEEPSD